MVSKGTYIQNSSYSDSEYSYFELQGYEDYQYSLVVAIRTCQLSGFNIGRYNGLKNTKNNYNLKNKELTIIFI